MNISTLALICVAAAIAMRATILVILAMRYFHFKSYDAERGTEYRFNEGLVEDGVVVACFGMPDWMVKAFRKIEKNKGSEVSV